MMSRYRLILVATLLVIASLASAQWSDDPALNTVVSAGSGEQVVPHLATVPDGSGFAGFTYVGYYDHDSGNYDVGLQLLSPEGETLFGDDGMIVSAHPQNSWVMDWSLAADHDGNAIVAFSDARSSGAAVNVYKISPDGAFLWGADGITVADAADFMGPPTVTVTSDNQVVVVWMQAASNAYLRMQRLDADGNLMLADGGIVVSEDGDMAPQFGVLAPSLDGDVILGWTPTYIQSANRQIKAQRFDASGNAVWSESVWVMDDSTIPMGRYFEMKSDGNGGAVFSWSVAVSNAFGVRAQRLDASGNELLTHNGLYVTDGGPSGQIGESCVINAATNEITVVFGTRNSSQSERGLRAQRFDAAGNRLWGSGGSVIMPQDSDLPQTQSIVWQGGAIIGMSIVAVGGGYGTDIIQAFRLNDDGSLAWGGLVTVASTSSEKDDLLIASNGQTVVGVWNDENDILAQNINADGTLGLQTVAIEGDDEPVANVPEAFAARQNFPNPFNPSTTIAFDLPRASRVSLRIYDAAGHLVRELVNAELGAASHSVVWDGTDQAGRRQPSGVYHYRLITDQRVVTRAMTMVK